MEVGEQITVAGLIQALEAGGGILRLADPADGTRRAYRRAIHSARLSAAVPLDRRLQHTGRDRGDLVIRLVPASDDSPQAIPKPVAIPDEDDLRLEGTSELLRTAASLRTSADARPRALRILRALSEEAGRRGYGVQLGGNGAVLAITVGRDRFEFDLFEEDDVVDIVPEAEMATKRFSWQRVSPRSTPVPSGRLVLRLHHRYRKASWADRTRWRLEDRLGHSLEHIESLAREAEERRRDASDQARQRRSAWLDAMAAARERHIEAFNRRRMETQLTAWDTARGLRAFANSLAAAVAAEGDPERAARMSDWQRRILSEADRIDPLALPAELSFVIPDDIGPADLEPHMPRGMSVHRPPDVPD
jgi:hypothetical protein